MNTTATATHRTVFAATVDQSRLRTRCISDEQIQREIADVRETALSNHAWAHSADHAGSVANKYGYPALTTGLIVVSDPDGNVVVWMCRIAANKVTLSGVVANCVGGEIRPLYDDRYSGKSQLAAEAALQAAHADAMTERD